MKCKYCGDRDESRLVLRSRLVNGKVVHDWVCFHCLWLFFFSLKHFVQRGDGNALSEELRERIKSAREG